MSIRELCAFFPHHSQWPAFVIRALRNDWGPRSIAKAQLYARGQLTNDDIHRRDATLRHQVATAGKKYFGDSTWEAQKWLSDGGEDLDGKTWMTHAKRYVELYDIGVRKWEISKTQKVSATVGHATLFQVVEGVTRMPTGLDAGPVTKALEWAKEQGVEYLGKHTTADLPGIIEELGLEPPKEAKETADWDRNALLRLSIITDP